MADFKKGSGTTTPFGRNEFLRSTRELLTEPYTLAASTVPAKTIDGVAGQKILQPGTVLAKITTGPEAGKVGPYQAGAADGRSTAANIVGLCLTFAPWQLVERDIEVSAVYGCVAVQAWCIELDATGASVPLSNTTADAMRGTKTLDVLFH